MYDTSHVLKTTSKQVKECDKTSPLPKLIKRRPRIQTYLNKRQEIEDYSTHLGEDTSL